MNNQRDEIRQRQQRLSLETIDVLPLQQEFLREKIEVEL